MKQRAHMSMIMAYLTLNRRRSRSLQLGLISILPTTAANSASDSSCTLSSASLATGHTGAGSSTAYCRLLVQLAEHLLRDMPFAVAPELSFVLGLRFDFQQGVHRIMLHVEDHPVLGGVLESVDTGKHLLALVPDRTCEKLGLLEACEKRLLVFVRALLGLLQIRLCFLERRDLRV